MAIADDSLILSVARGEPQSCDPNKMLASWRAEADHQRKEWRDALESLLALAMERETATPSELAAVEEDLAVAAARAEEAKRKFMIATETALGMRAALLRIPRWGRLDDGAGVRH